ncbi:MAG: diacylglycerol/polyprenol kinase family protein [Armatimonadota bacterium]
MTLSPIVGIVLVATVLVALLAGLHGLRGKCHPELLRKLVHVGMGATTALFPCLFETPGPVIALCVVSVGLLLSLRRSHRLRQRLGGVLDGVDRQSLGEIYFPLGVAALFMMADGDKVAYLVPLGLLTIGDAVAALVGVRYGAKRYSTDDGSKSWEGSIAFLLVAFLAVHLPLLMCTSVGRVECVLIAAILALLIAVLEAASSAGLDNLFIPLGSFALLRSLRRTDTTTLVWDLAAAILLVVFALAWRRRTTLTDSAAVGAALIAFVLATVGGWRWVLPPATLFALYALIFPPHSAGRVRAHTLGDAARASAVGLFWCLAGTPYGKPELLLPCTTAFAAQLAIIGVARAQRPGSIPVFGAGGTAAAAMFGPFVAIALLLGEPIPWWGLLLGTGGVLLAGAAETIRMPETIRIWARQTVVLLGSAVALAAPWVRGSTG